MVAGFSAPFVGRTPAPELAVLQQHQRHLRSQISWKGSATKVTVGASEKYDQQKAGLPSGKLT